MPPCERFLNARTSPEVRKRDFYWHIKLWKLDRAQLDVNDGATKKASLAAWWMKIKSFRLNKSRRKSVFWHCATMTSSFYAFKEPFSVFLSEWHRAFLSPFPTPHCACQWFKDGFQLRQNCISKMHKQLQLMWKTSEKKKLLSGKTLAATAGS